MIRFDIHPSLLYLCVVEKKAPKQNKTKQKLLGFQIWVCKTFGEMAASATSYKQDSHKGFTSRTFLSDVSLCL